MISSVYRRIADIIVPAAILTVAAMALPRLAGVPSPWRELLPYLPALTIIVGMLLSLLFRRGRVFLALLILAVFYWSVQAGPPAVPPDTPGQMVFLTLTLLFPVNLTLFCFMRERGVLTMAGRLRLAFVIVQGAIIAWLVLRHPAGTAEFLAGAGVVLPYSAGTHASPVPFILALVFLIAAMRVLLHQSSVDCALLATMAAVAVVSLHPAAVNLPETFIAAAGLILALGVVQDSHDMAFRDDLTGLPSRRALNERLLELGGRYVIAMLDVDHFKSFNDAYGHDVGDQVLRMVASRIGRVKGGGRPFRYGGEEFTVIFPRRRMEEAMPYLEEVRRTVAEYLLVLRDSSRPEKTSLGKRLRGSGEGETVSVTISIGVAESGERTTPAEVLAEADQALYRAKRKGRDIISK
ncbi:MAG TPA: GGDEF domain-containing protein [Geobacteraceae bacterium]